MQNYMADPFPNEFFFPNANSMVKTKIIPLSILYSYIYIVIFWILRFSCSKHPSATFSSYVRLRFGQSGIADPWMIFGEKSA